MASDAGSVGSFTEDEFDEEENLSDDGREDAKNNQVKPDEYAEYDSSDEEVIRLLPFLICSL